MPLIIPAVPLLLALVVQSAATTSARRGAPAPALQDEPAQGPSKKKAKKKKKVKTAEVTYPSFRLADHPSVYFAKGTHIEFRAHLHQDVERSEASTASAGDNATIDIARRNVGIAGEIANAVDYQVEYALTSTDKWRDVYADFKKFDAVRVQAGRFKLPFSLDENTGARNREFVFRSLAATHLAPGRDNGVMVHGRLFARLIGYEVGVFDHDGRNARTHNTDKVYGGQTTAARVTIQPIHNTKNTLGDFTVGVSTTRSTVPEGIPGLRGQTVLEQTFFSSSKYIVSGTRRRTGFELQLRQGPASLKSEWMRVETERRGESVEDSDLSPLIGQGWYVSGSIALTGERKADGVDKPRKPVLQGGVGSIEVAARVESLEFKSGAAGEPGSTSPRADVILGNRDQAVTFGVSWNLNRWLRIQANLIRETLADPSQGPLPGKASFVSKVLRFTFAL